MNLFYRPITSGNMLPGKIIKDSILNVYKNIHSDINSEDLIEKIEGEDFKDIYIYILNY